MAGIDLTRALTFGRLAGTPAGARRTPTTPWTGCPPGAARVADVGAGTGQLTARLRERRLEDAEELVARVCAETGRPTAALHHAALCFRWRPA